MHARVQPFAPRDLQVAPSHRRLRRRMTDLPPKDQSPSPAVPPPAGSSPQLAEAAAVSLRLLSGTVSKRTLDQLRQQLPQGAERHVQRKVAPTVAICTLLGVRVGLN